MPPKPKRSVPEKPQRRGTRGRRSGASARVAASSAAVSGRDTSTVMGMAIDRLTPVIAALDAMMPHGASNYEMGYKPRRLSAHARRAYAAVNDALAVFANAARRGEDFHSLELDRAVSAAGLGAGDGHMMACLTVALGTMLHPECQFSLMVLPDVLMNQGPVTGHHLLSHYLVTFELSGQRFLFDPWAMNGRINAGMTREAACVASVHQPLADVELLARDADGDAVEVFDSQVDAWVLSGAFGGIPRGRRARSLQVRQTHHELPMIVRDATLKLYDGKVDGPGFYYSRFSPDHAWVASCHRRLSESGVARVTDALPALPSSSAAVSGVAGDPRAASGGGGAPDSDHASAVVSTGATAMQARLVVAAAQVGSEGGSAADVPAPGVYSAREGGVSGKPAPTPPSNPAGGGGQAAPAGVTRTPWWDCCGLTKRCCPPDDEHDKAL